MLLGFCSKSRLDVALWYTSMSGTLQGFEDKLWLTVFNRNPKEVFVV